MASHVFPTSSQSATMSENQKLRQVYAEDINRAVVAALISLQDSNVIPTEGEAAFDERTKALEDELTEAIASVLEKHFDYPDYHNYN